MYIVLGIIFILLGLVMLIKPQLFFDITERWKNNSNTEPSSLYVISTRIGGCAFLGIGIAAIVISFC